MALTKFVQIVIIGSQIYFELGQILITGSSKDYLTIYDECCSI